MSKEDTKQLEDNKVENFDDLKETEEKAMIEILQDPNTQFIIKLLQLISPETRRKVLREMPLAEVEQFTEEGYDQLLTYAFHDRPNTWHPAECEVCQLVHNTLENMKELAKEKKIDLNFTEDEFDDLRAYVFSSNRAFQLIKEELASANLDCKLMVVKLSTLLEHYSYDAMMEEKEVEKVFGMVYLIDTVFEKLKSAYGNRVSFDDFPKNPLKFCKIKVKGTKKTSKGIGCCSRISSGSKEDEDNSDEVPVQKKKGGTRRKTSQKKSS